MEMPRLTDHHRKLERLVGRWTGPETMHPSQWDPKGGTAIGHNDIRMALGGLAVLTYYKQERDGKVTFEGHGVTTYDPTEKCYVLHWFDSLGSPPEVFKGPFDGDVMIMSHGGPGMHARMTYDFTKTGVLRGQMDMSPDGKQWNTLFESEYTKEQGP